MNPLRKKETCITNHMNEPIFLTIGEANDTIGTTK